MEEDLDMEGYMGEQRRILGLVADGRITVEDGDRLLAALDPQIARVRCPYCAEEIVAGLEDCPECGSRLGGVRDGRVVGQGVFGSMTTLGKGLVGIVLLLLTYRAWVQAAPPPERS
jgi:hypothetical protein